MFEKLMRKLLRWIFNSAAEDSFLLNRHWLRSVTGGVHVENEIFVVYTSMYMNFGCGYWSWYSSNYTLSSKDLTHCVRGLGYYTLYSIASTMSRGWIQTSIASDSRSPCSHAATLILQAPANEIFRALSLVSGHIAVTLKILQQFLYFSLLTQVKRWSSRKLQKRASLRLV
jgi:hypothetical protein